MRTPLIAAALSTALASAAFADMARYELDTEHTNVYFTVEHIGYARTLGIFTELGGAFDYDVDTQELGDVAVTIDAGSVNTFHDAR
ncbi:MAG: YceI family protein, partial [Pseudomonadota bacterium]